MAVFSLPPFISCPLVLLVSILRIFYFLFFLRYDICIMHRGASVLGGQNQIHCELSLCGRGHRM